MAGKTTTTGSSTRTGAGARVRPKPAKAASRTAAASRVRVAATLAEHDEGAEHLDHAPAPPSRRTKLGRRELLSRIAEQNGATRADARKLLDAILAEMKRALVEGRDLDLPPFGRLRQVRTKTGKDGSSSLVCRLRLGDPARSKSGKEPLAEPTGEG